jgi:hypothetical protein
MIYTKTNKSSSLAAALGVTKSSSLAEALGVTKSSSLAATLGVTKFITIVAMYQVTLCRASYVRLRCSTNPPLMITISLS